HEFSEIISNVYTAEQARSYVTHNEKNYLWVSDSLKSDLLLPNPVSIGVRRGVVRDGHIWLLGLDAVRGIDIDLHHAFGNLTPSNLYDLRTEVRELAVELLTSQINNMNTYFLDFEEMATSPFAGLIPLVVEARDKELSTLGKKPSISEASRTFYGLMMFANASFKQKGGGLASGVYRGFSEFLSDQREKSIELEGKKAKNWIGFQNCTRESEVLLNDVISMFIRGFRTRCHAIDKLGQTGDSRVIPWYLARLNGLSGNHLDKKRKFPSRRWSSPDLIYTHEVDAILVALGTIGRPELHDVVKKYADKGWKSAIWSLCGIRNSESVNAVMNLALTNQGESSKIAFCNLWRTEDPKATQYLYNEFRNEKSKMRTEALRSLVFIGDQYRDILLQNSKTIGEIFVKKPKDAIPILKGLPELFDDESIIQAVVKHASKGPSKSMAMMMREAPDLFSKEEVINAFWEKAETSTVRGILDFILHAPHFKNSPQLKRILEKRASEIVSVWKNPRYRYRRYRNHLVQPVFVQVKEIAESIAREYIESSQNPRYMSWSGRRNIATLLRMTPNGLSGHTRKRLEKIVSKK
ncbi:MAG: hypothetical protein ACFFF4_09870, partial [Candidatus Thorarchaeota archaeon]